MPSFQAPPLRRDKARVPMMLSARWPAFRAVRARAWVAPKWLAATWPRLRATLESFSPRTARVSAPVSMPTGQAVAHRPQVAQVSRPM